MFKVFYLEDPNLPDDHDLILDGYNMEVYQYFLPLNPYPDTVHGIHWSLDKFEPS